MIIIDGFDNTGKTTLANILKEIYDLEYLHSPSEYRYDFDKMVDWAIRELGSKRKAIYDRFSPLTDQVYGPILRGGTPYQSDKRAKAVVTLLRYTPHLIIYCRPPRDRIFNFGERDQMDGVIDNAVQLLNAYDELFKELENQGFNVLTYDYTNPNHFQSIKLKIDQFLIENNLLEEEK